MVESEKERTNRQLSELLEELRVALPGAQVLLAFLLTAPFQARFGRTSPFERGVLFAGILTTASGVLFLMAPSIYHRMRWQGGGKEDVVRVGHVLFLCGALCLAAGLVCALFLVGDFLFGLEAAIPAALLCVAIVGSVWYALPVVRGHDPMIRDTE